MRPSRTLTSLLAASLLGVVPATITQVAPERVPEVFAQASKKGHDNDKSHKGHDKGHDKGNSRHSRVDVIAHRGASRMAPEETLAAYRLAIAQGAQVLEGDVQLTKDGHMVLVHDDTLARTTNVAQVFPERATARVGEFTLAEIKQLDAGSWFSARYAGQKVPTVAEMLDLVNFKKVGVTLELKAPDNSPGVASKLAAELEKRGLTDETRTRSGAYQVMVHSRGKEALREFASKLPEVPLVYLTGGPMLADAELAELSTWTMGIFSDPRRTTAADIDRAHAVGLEVYNEPVDSPEQIEMVLDQGYDHLITNVPDIATAVRDGAKDPEPHDNGVVIDHVVPNPSGDDMQYENSEHITLRNTTRKPIDISGHSLVDNGGTRLVIKPGSVIQPGSLFRVYVGDGPAKPDASYTNHRAGILNNTIGDTIAYHGKRGEIVDVYSYIAPEV